MESTDRRTTTRSVAESSSVIGVGLRDRSARRLSAAFPECVLYGVGPESEQAVLKRCRGGEPVTVFVDVHADSPMGRTRTSLHFDQATIKVIGLCEECSTEIYDAILLAEFSGAIPVDSNVETYRRAAAAVQKGELWVSREYLSKATRKLLSGPDKLGLSERELAILSLILEESSNQDIADRLFISRETVRWHLKSLYAKLGISNRESARRFAKNLLFHS